MSRWPEMRPLWNADLLDRSAWSSDIQGYVNMKAEVHFQVTELIDEIVGGVVAGMVHALKPIIDQTSTAERLLDVEALAKHLGVTKQWVYGKVHANSIPHFKLGKYPRFRLSEVEQWLQEKAQGRRKASAC